MAATSQLRVLAIFGFAIATMNVGCNSGGTSPAESLAPEQVVSQSKDLGPIERRLKGDGCQFKPRPNSRHVTQEELVCTYDPTLVGSSAIAETESHLALLQDYNETVRVALADGSRRSEQKAAQLEARVQLVEERREKLKAALRSILDQEADVQKVLGSLGPLGCGVQDLKLSCPEPRDVSVAYSLRKLLTAAEQEILKLNESHVPVLSASLADYAALLSAIESARARINVALASYERASSKITTITDANSFTSLTGIKVEIGLIVSKTQHRAILNLIDNLEYKIRTGGHKAALKAKAFRRIVITPLASEPSDVAFGENDDAVVLPDFISPDDALKFLLENCRSGANGLAADHVQKLKDLERNRERFKASGLLASSEVGLSAEAGRSLARAAVSPEKARAAIEVLKAQGLWNQELRDNVSIVAGEAFAAFGTTRWTVMIDTREPVERIAQELRGLLHNSQERLAKLKAL